MWGDLPKSFRYSSRLSRLFSRSRHLDDDPVPSGSFLEQREDFMRFLVCQGSFLLPYSKRAATSYNGGIRRNHDRDEGEERRGMRNTRF